MLIICVKHRLRFRLILRNLVWKHNYRKQWSEKWWPETQFFSLFIYGQGTVCSSVYVFFFSFFVCFISVISIFLGQLPRNASLLFTHTLKSSWKQPQHIPIVGFFFLKNSPCEVLVSSDIRPSKPFYNFDRVPYALISGHPGELTPGHTVK